MPAAREGMEIRDTQTSDDTVEAVDSFRLREPVPRNLLVLASGRGLKALTLPSLSIGQALLLELLAEVLELVLGQCLANLLYEVVLNAELVACRPRARLARHTAGRNTPPPTTYVGFSCRDTCCAGRCHSQSCWPCQKTLSRRYCPSRSLLGPREYRRAFA